MQELYGAAGEILTAVDQISQGAQIQAAATQQASAAMEQIQRAAISSGDSSREGAERIEALRAQLNQSRIAVAMLTAGVAEGLGETRDMLDLVEQSEESVQRIDRIVDALGLVAVQTTMLAVSGSVEAARAGDLGQGFALVSSDIRSLARDSGGNAERIKDLVRVIHGQVGAVRRDLDQLIALTDSEVQKNLGLDRELAEVEASGETLRALNEDIARGADAMVTAVNEVLFGVQQIAVAAQETSGASAQAASAARQQSLGLEDLAAGVEEIALLAEELRKSGR